MKNVSRKCSLLLIVVKKRLNWFFLSLFIITAFFLRGYGYGVDDQTHYLTFVKVKLNPNLYHNDYLIMTHAIHDTIFVDFTAIVTHLIGDLEVTVFLFYILSFILYFFSIYSLAYSLFRDRKVAFYSLLFFVIPLPIAGSSIKTFETFFTLRIVAEALLIASVFFLMNRKWFFSSILAGFGFLFHPLTFIPYPLLIPVLSTTGWIKRRECFLVVVTFFSFAIPFIGKFIATTSSDPIIMDRQWRMVVENRMPYAFLSHWSVASLFSLFFFVAPLIYYLISSKLGKSFHPVVRAALIAVSITTIIHILSDVTSFRPGLELQLSRNIYLVIVFSILYFAKILTEISKFFFIRLFAVTAVCVIIFSIEKGKNFDFPHIKPRHDLEHTALWAKDNTSKDALFLIPPNHSGFRFFSERSVVTEYKEGAESLYSRSFALEWQRRQTLLADYYNLDIDKLKKLKKEFGIDYFVSEPGLSLPIFFQTHDWYVYTIPELD